MALNLTNTVVEFLQQNPEQKFTAREIANWIFKTYPDECHQKQKRSTATVNPLDNETALLKLVHNARDCRSVIQKLKPQKAALESIILPNQLTALRLSMLRVMSLHPPQKRTGLW